MCGIHCHRRLCWPSQLIFLRWRLTDSRVSGVMGEKAGELGQPRLNDGVDNDGSNGLMLLLSHMNLHALALKWLLLL